MAKHTSKACYGYPTQTDAVSALALQGLPPKEIAELTGIKLTTVYALKSQAAKRAGGMRATGAGVWTPEQDEKARRLCGATMKLIAEALGVPQPELAARAKTRGWLLGEEFPPAEPVSSEDDSILVDGKWVTPDREDDEAERAKLTDEDPDDEAEAAHDGNGSDVEQEVAPAPLAVEPRSLHEAEREMSGAGPRKLFRPGVSDQVRLRSEAGEYLHVNGHTMTRIARFYWVGSMAEAGRIKRRKTQFSHLFEVAA